MGRVVVMNQVTLDGVMQGVARPDEDERDGFVSSGWGLRSETPGEVVAGAMSARMTAGGGLRAWLFGRRTYLDLLAVWNERGGPFRDALNSTPKYVASTTLEEPLPWPNSTLLRHDIPAAVRALKDTTDGVLGVMGSGELIATLMTADLIDEYLLMIHPLVLGSGRRLFPPGVEMALRLIDCVAAPGGMVFATYAPARPESSTTTPAAM